MTSVNRGLWPLLTFLVIAVTCAAAPALAAPEMGQGEIGTTVRLEPADLGPGGEGVLVVTSVIENDLHLYADGSEAIKVTPIALDGVVYHVPTLDGFTWEDFEKDAGRLTWSKPMLRPSDYPNAPPDLVWQEGHDFELRIPVTIGSSVASDAVLGVLLDYSACDELSCYDRIEGQRAVVKLGAGGGGTPGDADAPTDVVAAPKEKVVFAAFPSSDAARVTLEIEEAEGDGGGLVAVVTFVPGIGFYLHQPPGSANDIPVSVEPLEDEGITWGDWDWPAEGGKIEEPYAVRIPFVRDGAERLRIRVGWQGCNDFTCDDPQSDILMARWVEEGRVEPPVPFEHPNGEKPPVIPDVGTAPTPVEIPPGEKVLVEPSEALPFPVVHGDDLDKPRTDDDWRVVEAAAAPTLAGDASEVETLWRDLGIMFFGLILVLGVGLAFTPCVLPIIPLTISVIGGGNPDIKKSRLTFLLTVYVLGLSLAYGAAGAASGFLGEAINLEAAFQNPVVIWCIAGIFMVMAAGMMGIFELQPPAWMERMRGGAQKKSGTVLGSFLLGLLAALIASPCTGPFVVGLITFVATTQDPLLGFAWLFTLGLGMGAVFFAAGSLNLLARPGPWMVWVRYGFGIILFGVALYLVAKGGLLDLDPAVTGDHWIAVLAVGVIVGVIAWWAMARHLVRKEGESKEVARRRGAILSLCIIGVAILVAWFSVPPEAGPMWIKVKDVAHMRQEVERAKEEGRPVVVDVWATYCTNCIKFDHVIADDPYLRKAFDDMVRLKIDETDGMRVDLRRAVGLPDGAKPRMAFFDEQGRIRRAADVMHWYKDQSGAELRRRVDFLFKRTRPSE
jgi:thiol:disulfide interchange protein